MKVHTILLDLDCTLCDFVAGCAAEWGLTVAEVMKHWTPGVYPMNEAIGHALHAKDERDVKNISTVGYWAVPKEAVTDAVFWARLNGKRVFWENLPKLPWCDKLVRECRGLVGEKNVHVVSSPSWCPSSYEGKVAWLKREFGPRFNNFALTPHKELFSRPGVVLIDDNEQNCETFTTWSTDHQPGQAILFPAHHNNQHRLKDDPLPAVLEALDLLM